MNWIDRDAAVVWHGFTQMSCYADNEPLIVERGDGHYLFDTAGNKYLDAISSLWVTTLGHHVPELDQAIRDQLDRVAHTTMLGNGNRIVIEFAEALARVVPVDQPHFVFASDGAAAVEQALKIAFQFWTNSGVQGRTKYLAFGGAYHGDSVGSLSLGDGGFGTDIFDPLRFSVIRAPGFNDPDCMTVAAALIAEHRDALAAVVVEPLVQGAAGVLSAPAKSFAAIQKACSDNGVLLICDEVATGFGRTGTLFASEQCGLTPDIMCLGKGITGGYLPMSATAVSQRVYDAFLGPDLSEKTFYHGHSYSGNALAAAVALRHLELFKEWHVLDNVTVRSTQLGQRMTADITPLPQVREMRLIGLMCAVEIDAPESDPLWARRTAAAMTRRGVLARSLGDNIILVPHLTSTADEIDLITDTLVSAINEACQ